MNDEILKDHFAEDHLGISVKKNTIFMKTFLLFCMRNIFCECLLSELVTGIFAQLFTCRDLSDAC